MQFLNVKLILQCRRILPTVSKVPAFLQKAMFKQVKMLLKLTCLHLCVMIRQSIISTLGFLKKMFLYFFYWRGNVKPKYISPKNREFVRSHAALLGDSWHMIQNHAVAGPSSLTIQKKNIYIY